MVGPLTPQRVLLLDAYAPGRAAIASALEELGHRVTETMAIEEAIAIARTSLFDVVIVDGDDARSLKLLDKLAPGVRIIVMTTDRAIAPPWAVVLQKPMTLRMLRNALSLEIGLARNRTATLVRMY